MSSFRRPAGSSSPSAWPSATIRLPPMSVRPSKLEPQGSRSPRRGCGSRGGIMPLRRCCSPRGGILSLWRCCAPAAVLRPRGCVMPPRLYCAPAAVLWPRGCVVPLRLCYGPVKPRMQLSPFSLRDSFRISAGLHSTKHGASPRNHFLSTMSSRKATKSAVSVGHDTACTMTQGGWPAGLASDATVPVASRRRHSLGRDRRRCATTARLRRCSTVQLLISKRTPSNVRDAINAASASGRPPGRKESIFQGLSEDRRCLACFFYRIEHGVERDPSLRYSGLSRLKSPLHTD